ncbi:tol-pal system YbgF family protein [Candidatus Omnitrophota bacterium]
MFKKISLILLLVCLITILTGCGNDDYALERRFWYTQRQARRVINNPYATPPRELERVVGVLREFVKDNPKTPLALEQEFIIGRLYVVKEMYDQAREQFKSISEKHSENINIVSRAVYFAGNSYELQDKWKLALQQYSKIMNEYPTTRLGLEVPIYIAKYYETKHQPEKMIDAYKEAIVYYDSLSLQYRGSQYGFMVSNLKAQCYVAVGEWGSAIGAHNSIIEEYKGKVDVGQSILTIALIYKNKLEDVAKAKEALGRLIDEHPRSRFIKTATAMLEELSGSN